MKIRKNPPDTIFEFDTLEELRLFDTCYQADARLSLLREIAYELGESESNLYRFFLVGDDSLPDGFVFDCPLEHYKYSYKDKTIQKQP